MKTLTILTLLLSSSMAFSKVKDKNCADYDQFTDVSKTEMSQLVTNKSATIIDVNSKDSYTKTKIPGAIHYASNKKNFGKVLPKDKDALIVAYCGGKMCSAWQRAAKKACEMGYTNIKHFSEGITGWNKSAAPKKGKKNS